MEQIHDMWMWNKETIIWGIVGALGTGILFSFGQEIVDWIFDNIRNRKD